MTTQLRQWEHSDPLKVIEREERLSRRRDHGCSACKFSEEVEHGLVICTHGVELEKGQRWCDMWREVE